MTTKRILEICTGSLDDCMAAEQGGADRIELNTSLISGGLTPSAGVILKVKEVISVPVIVMIRPRESGFVYNNHELSVMEKDIEIALNSGADGIAFGVLNENGEIDVNACKRLLNSSCGKVSVFHRAFDLIPDPEKALEVCIDLGFTRILTSGQRNSALEGADCIHKFLQQADGRIEILPAGGINPKTVLDVINKTGCTQVHGSLMSEIVDKSLLLNKDIKFRGGMDSSEHVYKTTDIKKVMQMRSIMDELN